jgi:putative DNA methylase
VNKEKAETERKRLFEIIKKLVLWENTTNGAVLAEAREEIWKSWRETCALNKNHPQAKELFNPDKLPAFHDPFAGGGAIPLEAQRLGLEAWASDLNPVAVLINKAMIEIPPKFAGRPPVNPESRKQKRVGTEWKGAAGLAEDVRYYGQWMRDEAEKRIGHLYPKVRITAEVAKERPDLKEYVGKELTVIAWLWARTVKSPNPAFKDVEVPLVRSFRLSTKRGKEAWVEPVIRSDRSGYDFAVRVSGEPELEGTVSRQGGVCIMSKAPMDFKYIRAEGKAGRMGERLMAVVVEGRRSRIYLSPTEEMAHVASEAKP